MTYPRFRTLTIPLACLLIALGCRIPGEPRVDTLLVTDTLVITTVDSVPVLRTDTLLVTHVDTVTRTRTDTVIVSRTDTLTRVDTVIRVDTLVSPPVHDTTIVVHTDTVTRVDTLVREVHDTTFVPRTDTLFVPSPVLHDTTWIYTQVSPTNPLGGGDIAAGVALLNVYDSYFVVFWHGNFVGLVTATNAGTWRSYLHVPGQLVMPANGDYPTLEAAVQSLVPVELTLTPVRLTPSAQLLRSIVLRRGR